MLVEQPVARAGGTLVPLDQDVFVLHGRRPNLAVPEALERLEQSCGQLPELPHLVGQDVPRPRWDQVRHLPAPSRRLSRVRLQLGCDPIARDAFDARAEVAQTVVDPLVATVDLASVADLR